MIIFAFCSVYLQCWFSSKAEWHGGYCCHWPILRGQWEEVHHFHRYLWGKHFPEIRRTFSLTSLIELGCMLIPKCNYDRCVWGNSLILRSIKFTPRWYYYNCSNTTLNVPRVMCRMDMEGAAPTCMAAGTFVSPASIQTPSWTAWFKGVHFRTEGFHPTHWESW